MSVESLERFIAEHKFFAGMQPAHIELLVGCASNVRFNASTYLFREGGDADSFFLIRHGRVALEVFAPQREPLVVGFAGIMVQRLEATRLQLIDIYSAVK
jgi:hypothetical protein